MTLIKGEDISVSDAEFPSFSDAAGEALDDLGETLLPLIPNLDGITLHDSLGTSVYISATVRDGKITGATFQGPDSYSLTIYRGSKLNSGGFTDHWISADQALTEFQRTKDELLSPIKAASAARLSGQSQEKGKPLPLDQGDLANLM